MKKKPILTLDGIRKRFEQAGFAIRSSETGRDQLDVRKHGCVCVIGMDPRGMWASTTPAQFLAGGLPCELEDHGYQKFWLRDGKRFPIRLQDLKALQSFDQEVRYLLKLKSLYGESLGTTCARSAYDRVEGRPDNQ